MLQSITQLDCDCLVRASHWSWSGVQRGLLCICSCCTALHTGGPLFSSGARWGHGQVTHARTRIFKHTYGYTHVHAYTHTLTNTHFCIWPIYNVHFHEIASSATFIPLICQAVKCVERRRSVPSTLAISVRSHNAAVTAETRTCQIPPSYFHYLLLGLIHSCLC